MAAIPIRSAQARDLAAITRIYEDAVRHGTASFEIEPPDEREIARRYEALRDGGYPYLVAELIVRPSAMPMPAPIGHGRPIGGAWRIRSISPRQCSAGGSAAHCSNG